MHATSDQLLGPLLQRSSHLKVGVVHGVAGVGERHAHRVCAVLRNGLLQRLEVACRASRQPSACTGRISAHSNFKTLIAGC